MTSDVRQPEKFDIRRLVLFLLVMPLFVAVFLFLPAGTWAWGKGWLLLGVFGAASTVASFYLRRANPDILAARINRHQGTEPWDSIPERLARWSLRQVQPCRLHVGGFGFRHLGRGSAPGGSVQRAIRPTSAKLPTSNVASAQRVVAEKWLAEARALS